MNKLFKMIVLKEMMRWISCISHKIHNEIISDNFIIIIIITN